MSKCKYAVILSLLMIIVLVPTSQVFARAGGGGGHAGGYYGNNRGNQSPIGSLVFFIAFGAIGASGSILFGVRLYKKNMAARKLMKKLDNYDESWDYSEFEKRVADTFFKVQNAWMERNQDIAKEYMSDAMYERHKTKTEWMVIRHEKNILKKMRLIDIKPVGVTDLNDNTKDNIWVYIEASMVDYTVDDTTMRIISGANRSKKFSEYWKFIRGETGWVLDEIRQNDDTNGIDLFDTTSEEINAKNNVK